MCGRARCSLAREQVAQAAGVSPDQFVDGDKYSPVENMSPGSYTPVLFEERGGAKQNGGESGRRAVLRAMKWGLIPSFTKPNVKPDHFVMFNARSENLQERPAYKRLVQSKRCVAICDGYYEWKQVDKREKQPYYFFRDGSVMKFAGLYDTWENEDGEEMHSCTILTTAIAPELKWLHTRMPVILDEDGVERWLSDAKFESLKDLLVAYQGADLKHHPVDKRIGSTKFQSGDCAKKVDIKHAADIKSFFGVKQERPRQGSSAAADVSSSKETTTKQDTPSSSSPTKPPLFSAAAAGSPERDIAPPQSAGFVSASSLLGKRQYDQDEGERDTLPASKVRGKSSPKSSAKSPNKLKSPVKPKRLDPKQGSLLSFFKPENPK